MRFLIYYDLALCQILVIEIIDFIILILQLIEQGLIPPSVLLPNPDPAKLNQVRSGWLYNRSQIINK